jgi:uncharacterized protein involved in exopolysaccharide biosynthesis
MAARRGTTDIYEESQIQVDARFAGDCNKVSRMDHSPDKVVPPGPRPEWRDDEMSIVEIANTILRQWRMVVAVPLVLALVVGLWTLSQDRAYAASASFIPQAAEGRSGVGAAALAQQFGVTLGSERPGESPQFYVDLLRSRTVLRDAVESEYQVPAENGTMRRGNLIELFDIGEGRGRLPPWRRAANKLEDGISTSVARETGLVELTVSAPHPALAEQIAQRLLEILETFNTEVRQSRAHEEGRFIGDRLTEAQAELRTVENALQEFLRQNRDFRNSPELTFEHDRLQRQVAMRQEVYTSLVRSQEQARIDAVRDTPHFTVVDHPAGTAEPKGRGTVMRAILAFLLGLVGAVVVAFLGEATRRGHDSDDPHYREFQGLAREAWEDLRRPKRWVRRGGERVAAGGD